MDIEHGAEIVVQVRAQAIVDTRAIGGGAGELAPLQPFVEAALFNLVGSI